MSTVGLHRTFVERGERGKRRVFGIKDVVIASPKAKLKLFLGKID